MHISRIENDILRREALLVVSPVIVFLWHLASLIDWVFPPCLQQRFEDCWKAKQPSVSGTDEK